jgi:predicted HTH transcriptional regulator
LKATAHYITDLISLGENLFLDFKYAVNDSKKIARSLVAFSNTKGGRLLVGVKDNGSIVGVRTDEEYYMIQAAAELYCKPQVLFVSKDWNIAGKKVLEIIIPESKDKPHLAKDDNNRWLAFIRVADENILANSVLLKSWQKQNSVFGIKISDHEPGKLLLAYLEDNAFISLSLFQKLAKISYQRAVNILSDYIVLNLIEVIYQDNSFVYRSIKK